MRILNRPMFRYGGPIKEGVMHGMRNNYQSGQLVRPGPGRPGYQGEGFWQKLAAQYKPKNLFKWSRINPFSSKKLKAAQKIPKVAKLIQGSQPFKNMQGVFTQTGRTPGITGTGAGSAWMAGPSKYLSHLKKVGPMAKNLWGKHRYKTIAGGLGLTSDPAISTYKWLGDKVPGAIKGVTPDWIENIFTGKEEIDEKDGTTTPFHPSQGNLEEVIKKTVIDPDAAKKLAVEKQNERLASYLDMMGYDRSKKTALSDALIDASALVQDATTEAGSLKKADWGNLINRAIQTTSKRLDKPEQIREAVGLMMTKGAIEKDIAESKGTPLDIKEKYLVEKLGPVAGERGALGKPTSLMEALNETKATDSKGDRTTQALMNYYDGHLVPTFKSKLSKKKIDDLGGDDVFKKDAPIALGDGVYQVSNSYIIVQGKKIIELADVFGGD